VRIEDIDHQRTRPGSASDILRTLDAFGFEWDGDVDFQSRRLGRYRRAAESLLARGLAYPCTCSRREVAERGRVGLEGPIYPGTCRTHPSRATGPRSLRLRTDPIEVAVEDRVQGPIRQQMERDIGDFVVHRADGVYAYQLAVVVDDADQGITDVVRGADLLLSTPRQVYLQRVLGLPTPRYAHLPVAVDAQGCKLSKSDAAAPVDRSDPLPALLAAWAFLGQDTPPERPGSRQAFWPWARARWRLDRVPSLAARPIAEVAPPREGCRQHPPLKVG
jgi:glutamyl-Q tRNA(Asp) synthetase